MAENQPGPEDSTTAFPVVKHELSGVIAVTVPAITDPDIASVDVNVSAMGIAVAVGDEVKALPQEALAATCRLLDAYVVGADSVRVVFGSVGGDVASSAKNFKFVVSDET